MKTLKNLFSAAVYGLALSFTLGATGAYADEIKQGVATVVRVDGSATYTLGANDGWHPLVAGKILSAGAVIKTQPDSTVDVVLGKQVGMPQPKTAPTRLSPAADSAVRGIVGDKPSQEQNVVRLSGGTTLKIDTLTVSDTGADTVSDTELDLQSGRIFASVKKLSDSSKYLVKVPNGIAGVRGTKFTLGADGSCGCIEHAVLLSLVGSGGVPTTVEVGAGNQFNPNTGQTEPLSPELSNLLHQIALAANISYEELVSYAENLADLCRVSPITGYNPHHDIGNGSFGNGGNGGGGVVTPNP
jgi:hypothetical protein